MFVCHEILAQVSRAVVWLLARAGAQLAAAAEPGTSSPDEQEQADDDDLEAIGLGSSGSGLTAEAWEALLGPPPSRQQRQLNPKERKAQRAVAETLAKQRRLVRVQVRGPDTGGRGLLASDIRPAVTTQPPALLQRQRQAHVSGRLGPGLHLYRHNASRAASLARSAQIGQLGLTRPLINAVADVLTRHEHVRVKLGEGAGLERRETAELLERYCDAVCVHLIGFTVTLYRQQGLPRPEGTVPGALLQRGAGAALSREAGEVGVFCERWQRLGEER
jgi:RNA-binding protein YhbY